MKQSQIDISREKLFHPAIVSIIEEEVRTNQNEFHSGKEYTAKLLIKNRLFSEAIHDIPLESDKNFLKMYLASVLDRINGCSGIVEEYADQI